MIKIAVFKHKIIDRCNIFCYDSIDLKLCYFGMNALFLDENQSKIKNALLCSNVYDISYYIFELMVDVNTFIIKNIDLHTAYLYAQKTHICGCIPIIQWLTNQMIKEDNLEITMRLLF